MPRVPREAACGNARQPFGESKRGLTLAHETVLPVCEIKVGPRLRKDVGDLSSLKQSIQEVGLLHPIIVDSENHLIAGLRRLKAVEMLGWKTVEVHIINVKPED